MEYPDLYRRVRLLLAHLLMSSLAFAQQQIAVTGQVLDSLTQQPLSYALVYVTPDTGSAYLTFDQTDDSGGFELLLTSSGAKLLLHARFLGYEEKTLLLNAAQNSRLTILLSPKSNQLKEVVVTQSRPPIIQQTDTTVYDVKAFTDSTEYNVEDVLKKLPGIEVKSDGQIAVNGKAVERVLIEGTDMFGRRYTIGTKNIRAGYLDKVEVIDHYQENPVLSHVNTSDAVVLNLKLKADKKNILNGTYDAGTGIGVDESFKGLANVNVFSISKKFKALFISSNGNTGMTTGAEEMQSAYDNPSERDVRTPVYQTPDFQRITSLNNPGLPAEFVDPSTRLFSTLRTSCQLNDNWEINANATFFQQRGRQDFFNEQVFFLNDDIYQLTTAQQFNLNNRISGADVYVKHFSGDNNRSLQLFGRWDGYRQNNRLLIEEFRAGRYKMYSIAEGQRRGDGAATALFTQKTGEKSVVQFQVKTARVILPQTLLASNDDFPLFWNVDTTLVMLSQQLKWRHAETELLARYTWAARYFILEVEPLYAQSVAVFENSLQLASPANDHATSLFPEVEQPQRIDIRRAGLNLHLNGQLNASTSWGLYLQGREMQAQYAVASGFDLQTLSIRALVNKKFKQTAEGRLSYAYQEQVLPAHYFITMPYFFDSYSLSEQDIRTANHAGHLLSLYYGARNAFKLRSWHVSLRYNFGQHLWRYDDRFEQSLAISAPFFSRNNERLVLNGYWDQFVPALKANIRLNASLAHAMGEYAVAGSVFHLGNTIGLVGGNITISPFPFLKFITDNHWQINHTFRRGDGVENRINTWRSAFTCMFLHNNWQISGSWNGAFGGNSRGGGARLHGYQLRAQKRITVNSKPMLLGIRIVNAPNIGEFSQLQSSDYFLFRSAVRAVPAFALINVDYSF